MPRILSGRQDIVSQDLTDGLWNPMTPAMNSAQFRFCHFGIWVAGEDNAEMVPGFEFSSDGLSWDGGISVDPDATGEGPQAVSDGWNYYDSDWDKDIYHETTPKIFVRFGIFADITTASDLRPVQAELLVEADPVVSNTITNPWMLVYADNSARIFPLTASIPVTEDIGEARACIEVAAESGGNVGFNVGWRQTNYPKDPGSWSGVSNFLLDQTQTYSDAGNFTTVTANQRYFQFVVGAYLNTGTLGMARVRTRIDYRRTTS
ncbi:MAG: hypothetical protein JRI25_01045 [Deltaproteobacteria bacterium]|nr:hypothetical protein [Deltaproteobacteria bacterium]